MPDLSVDEAFGQHVLKTGMATADQLREAMRLQAQAASKGAPIPLAEALVQQGAITARQRETVESKLEVRRDGAQMLGHFQILRKLGEGGMGAVYLAKDTKAGREVALKVLPKEKAKNPSFLKRFHREADAATQFNHVNIAQAYSYGEDKGYQFYVMEFCEGLNLKERLKRDGRLPIEETLQVMIQVARGLKYAHELGFVHRDIKPDNIIVTPQGIAKILDLGLSKNLEDEDQSFRTLSGVAIGTPHYLSPEQARGEGAIDGRADIYSLGATVYHLLTGDTPFHGTSSFDIITKHLTDQLRDPQDLREEIPDGVSQVIRRMMAKNPRDRYQSCHALLPDLELVIDGKAPESGQLDAHLSSVAAPARARPRPAPPSTRRVPLADPLPDPNRRKLWIGGSIAAAAVLLVMVVLLATGPRTGTRRPEIEEPSPPPEPPRTTRKTTPEPPVLPASLPPTPEPLANESPREMQARRKYQDLVRLRDRRELTEPQLQGRLDRLLVDYADTATAREIARQLKIDLPEIAKTPAPPPSRPPPPSPPPPTAPPPAKTENPPAPELVAKPPAPTPPPPPAPDSPLAGWREALAHLAARDAAAAAAAVEKLPARPERDADLAALKGAQTLYAEAPVLLSRLIKGRALAVDYWDVEGGEARIEGNVERLDALRIEIRKGDLPVTLPYGEIRVRSLAQTWLARPGAKPEDRAAAAFACAAEGDLEGAKSLGADTARFERLTTEALPAAESEARRIFWEAERAWFDFSRTQEAVDAYKALLADHGTTAFVRRNRAAIAARTEAPKEFYFEPADMSTAAGFLQGRSKKVETCWTSERDLEGAQRRSNFVEIAFPAAAGTAYRCWFYVGGCCQEVLTFFAQGTEFTGFAEPGGEFDVPVRHSIGSLKKRHQDHLGPKAPERWDWVSIPLPKYGAAGTKRVRLLSDQKGFSVGYAVVSATRTGSPSERDLATMEKLRSETPGFASGPAPVAGSILREWWTGIGGNDIRSLTTHRDFPNRPVGSELIPSFETPRDWADNYGTRVLGYILPPVSGDYVFWICSDDMSELLLSADDTPLRKTRIASLDRAAGYSNWTQFPSQKSAPIRLEAGRRYYIEALQKEGRGQDHLLVGWQLPDGTQERPIPGKRLAPAAAPRK
jgi:serine/threonine-protein kinase